MSQSANPVSARLGGQALVFLAGNVFTLLLGFPLQIFVARALGSTGLGVFGMIEGAAGLLAGLVAFGLAPTLVRFIPAHLELRQYGWIRCLLRRGMLLLLAASSAVYVAVLVAWPWLQLAWPALAQHRSLVLVMGLLIPLSVLGYYFQQGLRGFQELKYLVIGNSFVQLTVKALLAVVLLTAGWGLLGYASAVVVSVLVALAWTGAGLWRKVRVLPPGPADAAPPPVAEWSAYARVMYSGSLLGLGAGYVDRFLLGLVAGVHPVGILLVIKQLQQLPLVFLQMFLAIASPMFAAAHARNDAAEIRHVFHLTTDWVLRLSLPLLVFFFVFAEPLLRLYGDQFAETGVAPFRILLLAQLLNLAMGPVGQLMYMSGLENAALRLAVWQTLLNALGLLVLVPLAGLEGAALVVLGCMLFIKVAEYRACRRATGLRWFDPRYLRWGAPALVLVLVAAGLSGSGSVTGAPGLILAVLLLCASFHGMALLQGLHEDDRLLLSSLWARVRPSGQAAP